MLTKEECLKEIHNLERYIGREFECSQVMFECEKSLDVLEQLINEHFDNPPLKFEDLHDEMWVWDNDYKEYVKLYDYGDHFEYHLHDDNYKGGVLSKDSFEENRFYRYEVKNG